MTSRAPARRLMLTALAAAICATAAWAAPDVYRAKGTLVTRKVERLDQALNLDDLQKAQVQKIIEDFNERRNRAKRRKDAAALQQHEDRAIRELLTPEQQLKFDALKHQD